ncbi:MAG TPA: S41 family peptidase [Bacteroidales bacterium]|nr:S41 family peptidase [Bacteroidales bacterium]
MRNNMIARNLVAAFILLLTPCFLSAQYALKNPDQKETTQKFATLMQLINYFYVEDVDEADLTEQAIIQVLKDLDPHSVYIPKKEVQRTNEPLQGNFDGIGVQFQIYHDTIVVVSPVVGGPSEKLGILAGDKIVKINGEDAVGSKIDNQYVLDRLRGPRGTKVDVSIFRKNRKSLIDYTIIRDKIPINSIDATYMVSNDIGYVKLSRFARTSKDEFIESVDQLKKEGMKNLILDLRNNTGGYLDIAYELADQFLSANKLIVYTEGLRSPRQDFTSTSQGVFEAGKLVILIDEATASASEIVSGAVQDWDRGLIVGRRSFGKGLVQRPYLLPDSSMVRLTTARYYTPSGRCIQKPYTAGSDDYFSEVYNRYKHGEFVHSDSIKFPDSLKYYTHNKRLVYGGGGIMPDMFVPIDTSFISKYYTDVFRKNLLNDYTMQYIDANRKDLLKKFPDIVAFMNGFKNDGEMLNDFVAYAAKNEIPADDDGLKASGKQITLILKALLARNLYNINAYFEVIGKDDDDLNQAVKIINDDTLFRKLTLSN